MCNRISMYLKNVNISGVLEPAALCALSNEKNPFWVIAGELRGSRAGTEGGKIWGCGYGTCSLPYDELVATTVNSILTLHK